MQVEQNVPILFKAHLNPTFIALPPSLLSSAQSICATTPSRSTFSRPVIAIQECLRTTCGPALSLGLFCSDRAVGQSGSQWWSQACSKRWSMPCRQPRTWSSPARQALSSTEPTLCWAEIWGLGFWRSMLVQPWPVPPLWQLASALLCSWTH